ncbi:MAG TPA: class I SAM-dependent methyltransferase [Candidatus Acidoferrum sp.]|nr:class I SAM-dependent methyltransferase [Candidatus Acidoferrum sp.]
MSKKIASARKSNVSILEIGCNDATSLSYVPVPVERYIGFDAGWRSGWKDGTAYGLEAARQRYVGTEKIEFHCSHEHRDVAALSESFDFAFVLETFEYLETSQLESYVSTLAEKVRPDGRVISTMPNEKGIPLLLKHVGSHLSGVRRSPYSAWELLQAVLGRTDHVPRMERSRKGFDYERMAGLVGRYFRHVQLEPVDSPFFPLSLNLNIGMVASHTPLDSQ